MGEGAPPPPPQKEEAGGGEPAVGVKFVSCGGESQNLEEEEERTAEPQRAGSPLPHSWFSGSSGQTNPNQNLMVVPPSLFSCSGWVRHSYSHMSTLIGFYSITAPPAGHCGHFGFCATQMNQNKMPSRAVDSRVISRGPDFTPAFADFGRQMSGARGAAVGPTRKLTRQEIPIEGHEPGPPLIFNASPHFLLAHEHGDTAAPTQEDHHERDGQRRRSAEKGGKRLETRHEEGDPPRRSGSSENTGEH